MINTLFTVSAASAAETEASGARLARTLIPALEKDGFALVALSGELGAGKTAFTRGLVSVFSAFCRPAGSLRSLISTSGG